MASDNTPFAVPVVLRLAEASLPKDPSSAPQLKSPHDAVALFVHSCMLSVGFRLVGLTEDDRLDSPIEATDPKPLPGNWNHTTGSYGFRYAHSQSAMQYMIKVYRLGSKAVVMGLGLGDDKTASFEIEIQDFLSPSFFPYTHPEDNTTTATGGNNGKSPLQDGFIAPSRASDLAGYVKVSLVQKLVPSLTKPGYEEERSSHTTNEPTGSSRQQQPPPANHPREDPLAMPRPYGNDPLRHPRPGVPPIPAGGEVPPGFDDEYEVFQPPRGGYGIGGGGRNPLSVGADDLNPPGLGPNPPLRGPFFGEGGMGPMGGMHPTGDHPMFGGSRGGGVPDPRFPPGARYDPVGPGDEPMGGLRGPGRFGPPGRGGFGGPPGFGGFGSGDFI